MIAQFARLQYAFKQRSELELLNALCISYLRRNTPHTAQAYFLFRRIWTEHGLELCGIISTRWLISSLQTFYDYPQSQGEKTAGGMGFLYGNFIKVYETERHATECLSEYTFTGFRNRAVDGMHGFKPGDDILANINVLVLDAALDGGTASPLLLELMRRVKSGKTIFQRMDQLAHTPPYNAHKSYTFSFGGQPRRGNDHDQ